MAPHKPAVEHVIDRTAEYEKLIANLKTFHEARGTPFDAEPKMGNVNVDLLKLFNHIVQNGGYDKVSEEKLKWRQMCDELGLSRTNAPADAYALKQIFYKNLAAYEIRTIHNKEPPPPEILEFVTAKGGSLLTRTLENFTGRGKQPGAPESPRSIEDGTPARERKADEAPGSGRASRGLREAPPQRIPFTPDTNPSRAPRVTSQQHTNNLAPTSHPQAHLQTHAPSHHGHNNNHNTMSVPQPQQGQAALRGASHAYNPPNPEYQNEAVQNFQPQRIQPIHLPIVDTPSSNPEAFAKRQRLDQQPAEGPTPAMMLRDHLVPTALEGPNIYERCLLSLRSGIKAEQAFALNHLVKISYERGDKYKFVQFPGLAEGLTEKALEVGSLFYHVDWSISFDPERDAGQIGRLDGTRGTADILERIAALQAKVVHVSVQSAEFTDQLMLITEAVLTIRNMVMLPENAYFMSEYISLKDLLCVLLNLPNQELVVELKHFALDIAEQITPYDHSDANDPLYRSLLSHLTSDDRGIILTALRAIGRIAMNSPTEVNKLDKVPPGVLQNMMEWLLLNDNDLIDAILDFLYQYTAVVANLDLLLTSTQMEHLVAQLVRLLSHGAKRIFKDLIVVPEALAPVPCSEVVATVPKDLFNRFLAMEEPERCSAWILAFFEEDAESHITQIAIWQAYNAAFFEPLKSSGRPMINAAEFIRNIGTVYKTAGAQIVRQSGPMGEALQRFIIRGIRPRPAPVYDGREYIRCQWRQNQPQVYGQPASQAPCGEWLFTPQKLWTHILEHHLGELPRNDTEFIKNKDGVFTCEWSDCMKYAHPTNMRLYQIMAHVKIHIMKASGGNTGNFSVTPSLTPFKRTKPQTAKPAKYLTLAFEETTVVRDERNPNAPPQAGGIPFSALLVLRNIARNIGKTKSDEALRNENKNKVGGEPGGWGERIFRPVVPRLFQVMTENKALAPHLYVLLNLLESVLK